MRVLATGTTVAGYRIESLIGRGGMGVVYRARELGLERTVALKVISPALVGDGEIRERFLREARAAAAVEHPHVIPVHAAGIADDVAFIAMRLVDGEDLRVRVRRERALDTANAVALVEQAAAGLDAIHRAGFVHRDIKPANLLLDRSGHLYVGDFGLVKHVLSQSGATRSGQWVGSLDYIAPEQIRGGRIDARADIYALGGVLYFALTGRVPFEHEGDEAKLWAQLSAPPPVPSSLRPGVSPSLDQVVARAMSKQPEERFPSAGDLALAAKAAAGGTRATRPERMVARGAAAPAGARTEPGLAPEATTVSAPARPPRAEATRVHAAPVRPGTKRGRRTWAAAAAGLVLLAAGVVAIMLLDGDPSAVPDGDAAVMRAEEPVARVSQTIEGVGDRPGLVVHVAGQLWVSSYSESTITRLDAGTGAELRPRPRPGRGVTSMSVDGDTMWAVVGQASLVLGFDVRTGKRVRRLQFSGTRPRFVAAGPSGVWILMHRDNDGQRLLRYDRAGRRLRDKHNLGRRHSVMTLGGGFVWISDTRRRGILKLDERTGRRRGFVPIRGEATTLTYAGGHLWAVISAADTVVRLDQHNASERAEFAAGRYPTHAVLADGRLYVASRKDHSVVVFDPRTTRPLGPPIDVPQNPSGLTTDGYSAWVTGLTENTVSRIVPG